MNIHDYRNLHLETFPATNRQVSHELNRLGAEGLLDPLAGTGSATETSKKNLQTARKHSETMVFVDIYIYIVYIYIFYIYIYCIYLDYIVYILGHNLGVVVWIGGWDSAL